MVNFVIKPLDHLIISDPELDGSHGLNREEPNPSEPIVDDDISAAREFLAMHEGTQTTQRNYTKEIERLILWSINVKGRPVSSLSYKDMGEFIDFLASPSPIETWASKRKFPRDSSGWRPFVARVKTSAKGDPIIEAGLSPSSRLTAMASLSSFFAWLVDYGYLIKNPMRQIKTKRKAIRTEAPSSGKAKVERFLDEEMWAAFNDAIEAQPRETERDIERYERSRFIAALLLFLAPRASELSNGKMNDFRFDGEFWWWHTIGKGSKHGKVPANEGMLSALIRYRAYLELTPLPLETDDSPLLRSIKDKSAITPRQLNYILDDLFEDAAKLLELKASALPENDILGRASLTTKSAKIRHASAHWGRHTSITFQVRSGIPREIVQLNARHNKAETTDGYTHEDEARWHQESEKLHK